MNRVVRDYLRRWKWLFIGIGGIQFLSGAAALFHEQAPAVFAIFFAGVFPLTLNSARGFMRVSATLPIPRREIATRWWWITVPVPSVIAVVLLVAGEIVFSLIAGRNLLDPDRLLLTSILTFVLLGTMFYAFLGLRQGPVSGVKDNVLAGFFGSLWGICIGGAVLFAMTVPGGLTDMRLGHWIFLGLAGWATFVGFRDREEMVSRKSRLLRNDSGGRAACPASRSELAQYPAGISLLVWRQFKLFAGIGAVFGVFGFLFNLLFVVVFLFLFLFFFFDRISSPFRIGTLMKRASTKAESPEPGAIVANSGGIGFRIANRMPGLLLMFGMAVMFAAGLAAGVAGDRAIDFGRDIQPLLAEYCYACHGPDSKTRKAGLRLDRRDIAVAPLKSGARAIVPGSSDSSEMVRRLFSADPDETMPPSEFRKRPSVTAKRLLKSWIDSGAGFARHWAFEPVDRPELPEVKDTAWTRNPIDRFILARLERAGMRPSAEADRVTLVRRLSLDLRGLPPSLAELETFSDDSTEGGYDRVVDAMLASQHYGERMAQDWLDLARFGDTNGYHNDSDRSMWLYRDYVIRAFNENKPFDRFILENMAGDLLPEADDETRIASGFNRCVTFNEEGGADPDEFHVTYAVDRVNTTGQVFMGLTVGCAQCHDHKYDPISQKEFYQLFAFFNSVDGEIGAGGQSGYHNKPLPPLMNVATDDYRDRIARLDRDIERTRRELERLKESRAFSDPNGPLRSASEAWAASLSVPPPRTLTVRDGLTLWLDAGRIGLETAEHSETQTVATWPDHSGLGHHAVATGFPKRRADGLNGRPVVRLDGVNDFFRTRTGAGRLAGDFTTVLVAGFHGLNGHQMAAMWGEEAPGKRRALWKTAGENRLAFNGYARDVVGSQSFAANAPAIAVVSKRGADHAVRLRLDGRDAGEGKPDLVPYENEAITIGANNAGAEKAAVDLAEVLIYDRALSDPEEAMVGKYLAEKYGLPGGYQPAPAEIMRIAATEPGQWSAEERAALFDFFVSEIHPPTRDSLKEFVRETERLERERDAAVKNIPTTMVMVEMAERKPAFVLSRGDFQQPGERVAPDVPAVFPRLPDDQPRNRLGLAHWLIDPRNPLVARVTVNRIWKQLFGAGLVRTPGDFGTQGGRPSHPGLLDWLAADFVEHGWDVKRLQRLIVRSATYRQTSRLDPRPRSANPDPENRLLSRAPRFRLSAEHVRDAALAISGLLNPSIGGPSVHPHQPEKYLASIGKSWTVSSGDARHRRGLYTFWRRTMLYPTFQIFDAPSREFCSVDRPRTNTPLQALATLNDPAFVEAARAFGRRILSECGGPDHDDAARLEFAFAAATSRRPSPAELRLLLETLAEQRSVFARDPEAAARFTAADNAASGMANPHAGELAAWSVIGNILLNLDETISRE